MPHPIRPNNTTAWMLKHGTVETEINVRNQQEVRFLHCRMAGEIKSISCLLLVSQEKN